MNPRLFIIVVNWNLKNDTATCIRSLERAKAKLDRIIVVDNGSTDDSISFLRETFGSTLHIVELSGNKGFTAAANVGIRRALQQGAEWLFLINNDTWVAENFFEKLLAAVSTYPQYSVFGPAIYYADDPEVIWFLGERLVPGTMLTVNRFRGKSLSHHEPGVLPTDFLSGCAMLVKHNAFEDVGLLDASLFMYGEEVDWCWRARRAGYRMAVVPAASMWHKISASSPRASSKTRYLRIRNQIWGYRRYGNLFQVLLLVTYTFFRALFKGLGDLFSGQVDLWQSTWQGWADGWRRPLPPILETVQD